MFLSQKIYVALDEPDGVAGVAAVRTTEATLNEQILQYESTGMSLYWYTVITPITGAANCKYTEGILSQCITRESGKHFHCATAAAFGVTDHRTAG